MREALGSLARICYGKSPAEVLSVDGEVPVIGTGGIYASATRALYERGVIVARKGSLGTPHLMKRPFWPSDTTFALLPNNGVDLDWLYFNLLNFDLTKLNEATGVPSIGREWLAKVKFLRLEQPEQQRIAAILTSLDNAIEATEALIEKHQQIKAGLMHDLFTRGVLSSGELRPSVDEAPDVYRTTDLGSLPVGWRVCALSELLAPVPNNLRSGPFGSALLKHELSASGAPLLGIDNIHVERFVPQYSRFVDERKFLSLSRYAVRPNDVVITIMGTVGRCCVLPLDIGPALSSKHLWTMTLDQGLVLSSLICWQLNHASWARAWFRRGSQGGIMDAIQSSTLKSLRLPVPPMAEQEQIADRYAAMQAEIQSAINHTDKLRSLKLGLMQDLLTGKVRVPMSEAETAAA